MPGDAAGPDRDPADPADPADPVDLADLADLADLVPGAVLVGEIGRGARSVVYRATRDGADYAVKVVTTASAAAAADFRREAALMACLRHPGLVRVHEVGATADRSYVVMDLVEGRSLAAVLAAGPVAEGWVARVGAEVAEALAVAHRAGLVHRDVKPENIMITPAGQVRVVDFGLAARLGQRIGDMSVGTFVYSAPEQTGLLDRPVDGRADLYALGGVLFECLAGAPPFEAADTGEIMRLHLATAPPDLRDGGAGVGPALAAVVARLLAKDPDDRYQTAAGLAADLTVIAGGEPADFRLGRRDDPGAAADGDLAGRAAESDQLLARWRRAVAGGGGMALIQGPSGAGKSRLARELTAAVTAAGLLSLQGKHEQELATPLAAVRAAVDSHLAAVDRLAGPARTEAVAQLRTLAGPAGMLLKALSPALAAILAAPDAMEANNEQQFTEAVAAFLGDLARAAGGAVLHLDDVHWADDASRRLLRQLGRLVADVPLLVVLTARDDPASQEAVESLVADLGPALDLRLRLAPLEHAGIAAMLADELGGAAPPALVARVAAATGGSPLAVREYVQAVLDAGLLRPSWGDWLLDEAGLAALALPEDVIDLVLGRVDRLGAAARGPLTVAAAVGARFPASLVVAVTGGDPTAVSSALAEATGHRLVVPAAAGHYAFEHDRIREALLSSLDPAQQRRLHQQIAEELDRTGGADPEHVFEVARHYLAGDVDLAPERVYRAVAAAGSLALRRHAPTDALAFLIRAAAAAAAAGLEPDSGFLAELGAAAVRTGNHRLAVDSLQRALTTQAGPGRRANLYRLLADAQLIKSDGIAVLTAAERGLAELGHPLPRNPLVLAVSTLAMAAWCVVLRRLPRRLRVVTGARADRYRLRAALLDLGGEGAAMALHLPKMTIFGLRSMYVTTRLGPGAEYAFNRAGLAAMAGAARLRRTSQRLVAEAREATPRGDPRQAAHIEMLRAVAVDLVAPLDVATGDWMRQTLRIHGRWMDLGDYMLCVGSLQMLDLLRGYRAEADDWHRQVLARSERAEALGGQIVTVAIAQIAALGGQPAEAARRLQAVRDYQLTVPHHVFLRILTAIAAINLAVEQGEVGAVFDDAVAEFRALGYRHSQLWPLHRAFWAYQAFGRLGQLAAAPPAERPDRLRAATAAVAELRRAAVGPLLRAHYQVSRASLDQLRGDHRRALRRLARLAARGGLDLPLLDYEIARVRARALAGTSRPADARRQAGVALQLATEYGWQTRARWVCTEFGLPAIGGLARRTTRSGTASPQASASTSQGIHQRRLQAVHQVSLAAATVLEPSQLARVALDEIIGIFGAERAFLFRCDTDNGELVPYLGRDAGGGDFGQLTGYGSSLVERVRQTGEALIVTGTEEGAALGSRSAMVHGLRSIMVAPMVLKGLLQGVVYLDSRAAKGIFTADDIEILTAITNHVVLGLETARAAQLELAVRAAERARDVAELLHRALVDLGTSLDPVQVAERLIDTIGRSLPVDRAVLLDRAADGTLTPATGATGPGAAGLDPAHDAGLAELLGVTATTRRTRADGPPPHVLGPDTAAWLAVPLISRGERGGLLLAGTAVERPYTEAEAQIAAALAEQGAMAYQNALLFRQVEDLAATDGLTGLFNRRHFFQVAHDELDDELRGAGEPAAVAALMVDIDHFKAVNDAHGHATGDDVIREVAHRLAASLRAGDICCRYGGEEFAILLPSTTADAARVVAARLHAAVTAEPVRTRSGALAITVSVGLAEPSTAEHLYDPGEPANGDLDALLSCADQALYQAKNAGRNRIAVHRAGRPGSTILDRAPA